MRYLGLDYGSKTLGVAISDASGFLATSLKTISYTKEEILLQELKELIKSYHIEKIILGLPKNMNNTLGERAEKTIQFAKVLEDYFQVPVELEDERLTTIVATNFLLEADMSRKKRKKVVDKMAASIILQTYLDRLRRKENEKR